MITLQRTGRVMPQKVRGRCVTAEGRVQSQTVCV